MKILLLARSTLFNQRGGDTVQVEQTAHYLRNLGFDVTIGVRGGQFKVEEYEVVHFFNLFRPADLMPYLGRIKKLVVTTIYVDYTEYDSQYRGNKWSRIYSLMGTAGIEYLKTCFRWLSGKERFPGIYYLLHGQKQSIRKIIAAADFFITASDQEARAISRDFAEFDLRKSRKVSLGAEHFEPETKAVGNRKAIACVARIEGIKNQLNLIKAVQDMDTKLHLYGNASANQASYLKHCREIAGSHIFFEGFKTTKELARLLPQFKVHALPSFYETTGLSTIEALKAGCQVVITRRGGQEEIFGNRVFYCDPTSINSIKEALEEALAGNENHSGWAIENFSWKAAANEISDIYRKIQDR